MPDVIATVRVSPPRQYMALASVVAVGGLLIYVAFAHPPAQLHWRLFLLVAGVAFLWLADCLRRASGWRLDLTTERLSDTSGLIDIAFDDIEAIDRGVFALKPSSGFRLKLRRPQPRGWAPGLWWRFGRNLGVGGVTVGREGKYMGEAIETLLAQRRMAAPPRNG